MSVLIRSASAAVLASAALFGGSAIAAAQPAPPPPPPPPACSTADQAGVLSGVSASLSGYLFARPDVNGFITGLRGLPPEERRTKVREYLDVNPGVAAELRGIRQPMTDFRARCGLPPAEDPTS